MIAEQLQAARAAHWRQQHPLLTLDDAQSWLGNHPLCLYLPRRAQLPAPAPSFVEAALGKPQTMPGADAIAQAQALLTRLVAGGAVAALNLLGSVGEQPDFLATREALPFVLCLRADADWKHAPQKSSGHKVSPLVLELWKLLEQQGGLTAAEARTALGRELTEAAVLRALAELWQGLRISPVYGEEGQPARWEMMRVRHGQALTTAAGTGQVTAISLLVSMYLQSVYAATGEEIEIFLSPVTSRSRVREAVRGLSATRQIQSLSMDAQTYYFLQNGLPAFATVTVPDAVEAVPAPSTVRPKRREHPLAPAPGAAVAAAVPPPARPEPPAGRAGWKSPHRVAGDARPWRPKPPADPSTPLRSGRDANARGAKPAGFARAAAPPRARAGGEGRPPFNPRSGPPRSGPRNGPAAGPRLWRPKTTADPSTPLRSGRDDKARGVKPAGFARAGAPPRARAGGAGRPPFKPRSGPPQSGLRSSAAAGARPWRPKTTADRSATPRSASDDKGRAAKPGKFARAGVPPRTGGGGGGRPPFKPRSGPPRSSAGGEQRPWRPKSTTGRDDKGNAARPPRSGPGGGKARAPFKPRPAKAKGPGDYPRRKPDRKKPGA